MRIDMYSPIDRCLFVHDSAAADWVEGAWIRRGDKKYSPRELLVDPAPDQVKGFVIVSAGHPSRTPWVRGRWVFLEVSSADSFLDEWKAETSRPDGDDLRWRTMRELDEVGVITGPVETIVIFNKDRDWPAVDRSTVDRTKTRKRGPKPTRPRL